MKYKLVIFDFDGTLADSGAWALKAINPLAVRFGFNPVPLERVDELRSSSAREVMALLKLPWWKLPRVARAARKLMKQQIDEIALFDGVGDVLRGLASKKVDVAIVTSNSEENVRHVLGEHNAALVKYAACSASLFGKRSKARAILRRAAIPHSEVLCVGDEIRDAQMAASLGLDFRGVSWGYTHSEALEWLSDGPVLTALSDLLLVVAEGTEQAVTNA